MRSKGQGASQGGSSTARDNDDADHPRTCDKVGVAVAGLAKARLVVSPTRLENLNILHTIHCARRL